MRKVLDGIPITDEEAEFAEANLGSVDFELSLLRSILSGLSVTENGGCPNQRARLFKLLATVMPLVENIKQLELERLALRRKKASPKKVLRH